MAVDVAALRGSNPFRERLNPSQDRDKWKLESTPRRSSLPRAPPYLTQLGPSRRGMVFDVGCPLPPADHTPETTQLPDI